MALLVNSYNFEDISNQTQDSFDNAVLPKSILEILNSGNRAEKVKLKNEFSRISEEAMSEKLEAFYQEITESDLDSEINLKQFAELVPFQRLERVVYKGEKKALQEARQMLKNAKADLKRSNIKTSPSLRVGFLNILDSLLTFLESIVTSFGIAEFFKPADSQFEKDIKFQKIVMLVSFFGMLTAIFVPVLGPAIGSAIVGGTLLFLAVLSIIYPKICPVSLHIPDTRNLSKECRQGIVGNCPLVNSRAMKVREVATLMNKGKNGIKNHRHPLLVGESGVGKNETVYAFAKAVERGDIPHLKGKKVFYVNASELSEGKDLFGNDPLKRIKEAIGRHRNNIILVVDEIHNVYKNSNIGERMKTRLESDFQYVIGMTTTKEYNEYLEPQIAFMRRFKKIELNHTTSEETEKILKHELRSWNNGIFCDEETLKHIIALTKGKPQPLSSIELLKECGNRISEEIDLEKTSNLHLEMCRMIEKVNTKKPNPIHLKAFMLMKNYLERFKEKTVINKQLVDKVYSDLFSDKGKEEAD